jgi:hypothetical protein
VVGVQARDFSEEPVVVVVQDREFSEEPEPVVVVVQAPEFSEGIEVAHELAVVRAVTMVEV